MNQSKTPFPKISDEQLSMVLLVLRYCCVTLELLQHLSPGTDRETLRVRMCRLQKQRWLAKTILGGGEPCYALGPRALRLFGLRRQSGFPFAQAGLLQHLAIASFCALAGYERMLRDDFRTRFPGVYRPGLPTRNFCIDRRDDSRLCWVLVDHASEPRRFKSKAGKVISRLLGNPAVEGLMATGQFRIVIITATPEKQARIQEQLSADVPTRAVIEVIAIPSLLPLYLHSMDA